MSPIGSPPAHATLRAAPSTACTPAANGVGLAGRAAPAARPRARAATAAAAAPPRRGPGRRTVREPTRWSYCSITSSRRSNSGAAPRAAPATRPAALLDLVARALVGQQARGDRRRRRRRRGTRAARRCRSPRRSPCTAAPSARRRALHRVEHLRPDDRDHPLLRLRDHDLPRLHARPRAAARGRGGRRCRRRRTPSRRARTRARRRRSPAATRRAPTRRARRETSISFLPVNGSPTWTDGRLSASSSPSSGSRAPTRRRCRRGRSSRRRGRRALPGPLAFAERSRAGVERVPTHIALTRQLPAYASSKTVCAADRRHADAVAVVADAGRRPAGSGSPARRTRARRGARSAARPSRRCRAGSRRSRSPRPGTARPRTGGCATRP